MINRKREIFLEDNLSISKTDSFVISSLTERVQEVNFSCCICCGLSRKLDMTYSVWPLAATGNGFPLRPVLHLLAFCRCLIYYMVKQILVYRQLHQIPVGEIWVDKKLQVILNFKI